MVTMRSKIAGLSTRFAADTRGGVAIVTALAIPVILGFSALALEYGSALHTKSQNQRTSDIAAFAAAHAYKRNASGSAADKQAAARSAAYTIADLNGVSSSGVKVSFDDPADATTIDVTISEDKPIFLSRLLRPDDSVTVNTVSRVALGQSGGFKACIVALDPDAKEGFRANGNSGTYNLTGCGIGANAEIEVNGGFLDTSCAAPSFKAPGSCDEEMQKGGFTDPLAGLTNWPNDPSDDALCDHVGTFPDAFLADSNGKNGNGGGTQTGDILKPGVLCVTGLANGNFGDVISDPDGTGNTLMLAAGVDFIMGGKSLSIKPPETGDFQGIGFYGPKSQFRTNGKRHFSMDSFGCFGLVAGSWRFNGTVSFTAECDEDDPNFDATGPGTGDRPILIQ